MPRQLEDALLASPVLVIVGDVVDLHDRIGWFGQEAGLKTWAPGGPQAPRDHSIRVQALRT